MVSINQPQSPLQAQRPKVVCHGVADDAASTGMVWYVVDDAVSTGTVCGE